MVGLPVVDLLPLRGIRYEQQAGTIFTYYYSLNTLLPCYPLPDIIVGVDAKFPKRNACKEENVLWCLSTKNQILLEFVHKNSFPTPCASIKTALRSRAAAGLVNSFRMI